MLGGAAMKTEDFRAWLKARRGTDGKPLTTVSNRITAVKRFELHMRDLGLPWSDLDAAFDADGMAGSTAFLKSLRKAAEQGEPVTSLLVGETTIPLQRVGNMMAAVRNYRQFREAESNGSRDPWPELEALRDRFLERAPDFESFQQTDGTYYEVERACKDAMVKAAQAAAASADSDPIAGHAVYNALRPQEGPPLRWQTINAPHGRSPSQGDPLVHPRLATAESQYVALRGVTSALHPCSLAPPPLRDVRLSSPSPA